jgi:hypothetical protein
MPIYPLHQGQAFEPELIDAMAMALEDTLRVLQVSDRKDPLNTLIAKRIIRIAQTGEHDPGRIRERVLQSIKHVLREARDDGLSGDGRLLPETCEAVLCR